MPPRQLRGGAQGAVGERHPVVLFIARPQPGQYLDRLVDARLLEHHALQPAREPPVALYLLELVERRRPDESEVPRRQQRLDQHREVHRAAGGGPRPHRRVNLVDEEDGQRTPREGVDDGLETLLEVASEPGAREQRGGVEGEDLGAVEARGDVVVQQPARESFRQRGLAHAGVPHEDGVVLAPAAEDLQRAPELAEASDEGVEAALPGALGQVDGEGGEGVARGGVAVAGRSRRRRGRARLVLARRRLGDAVRDVVQDVEPGDVLRLQQLGRVRVRLLQDGREDIAEADLVLARALHVEHRRLQHALERQGLLRLALPALLRLLEAVEERVEGVPQGRQVGAAGGEDLLALGVVGQHVEQVLEGQVRMPAHRRLAVRDVQDELDGGAEHGPVPFTPPRGPPAGGTPRAWPGPGWWRPWSRRSRGCRCRSARGPACGPAS